jgi:hypothetical protein
MLFELFTNTNLCLAFIHWALSSLVELTGELITVALLICFVALSSYENRSPREIYTVWQSRRSYQTNLSLFVFNSIFVSAGYGLLSLIPNPAVKALLSFFAVDLLLYGWHRACHRFEFLWLFHRIHHSDQFPNVSTAFRMHFLEILTTTCLKAGLIIFLGIDKISILAIETLILVCMMFHHTNTRFKFERIIGNFITVPSLYRIHHAAEPNEHNHNYGVVFSLWDRLFRTSSVTEPSCIELKELPPESVFNLIRYGFGWEEHPIESSVNLDSMIAEAAYYKAEKRNFHPGDELLDWLEAKTEILTDINKYT